MENPSQKPSGFGTFMKGFMNSAGSGALMSGIFYTLAFAAQNFLGVTALHMTLATVIPGGLLMVAAVGLFGGIMAMKREGDEAKAVAQNNMRSPTRERSEDITPVMVPMLGGAVSADRAEETAPQMSWAERTGNADGHRDRVQQILANGSMNDKDRASAILAERETSSAQAQQIG